MQSPISASEPDRHAPGRWNLFDGSFVVEGTGASAAQGSAADAGPDRPDPEWQPL